MKTEVGKICSHEKDIRRATQRYIILPYVTSHQGEALSIVYYSSGLNIWRSQIPMDIGFKITPAKFTIEERRRAFRTLFTDGIP